MDSNGNGNGHSSRSMLEYGLIVVLVIIVIYGAYYMYNKKKHPMFPANISCSADADCPKGQSCSIPKSMMMYGGSSTGTCVPSK